MLSFIYIVIGQTCVRVYKQFVSDIYNRHLAQEAQYRS